MVAYEPVWAIGTGRASSPENAETVLKRSALDVRREMERAGYLQRERDPDDRRVVRVRLVPAAVERVEMVYRWRGDSVEEALEGMSPAERAAVTTFLRRFVDAARARG